MKLDKGIINEIKSIIVQGREQAILNVDNIRVMMYWKIGKRIFEVEQQGRDRAEYGTFLIKTLAKELQPEYGSGFSVRQLERYRQFFRMFPIASALRTQLNWTHYKLLLPFENQDKREYYILEATRNNWTARQLERQINSQLFERLLLSSDKEKVLEIARGELQLSEASEIIKDPMVLEFLGLRRESAYYERDFETALITHLQEFLLELGNGFSFVARQKRILIDSDEFFVDLVFYNRFLQCFVIIEIKINKLTHQDLGQLQMYVNYYDRYEKRDFENPTIGVLLCVDKNDAMVKITLPEDNKTILASKYQLYLPSEEDLLKELKKEINNLKSSEKDN
jgi:predicted nuclease of restriction endonuclease-like (RecB) superfamily